MMSNVPQDVKNLIRDICEMPEPDDSARTVVVDLDWLEGKLTELLRAQREQGAEAVLYARSNELAEPILKERQVMLPVQNVPDDIYDAPLYRSPPQANALVAAAYRDAAELAEECADQQDMVAGALAAAKHIRNAIPADAEAALREVCMRVAKSAILAGMTEANHECTGREDIKRADAESIVNSVLEGKS